MVLWFWLIFLHLCLSSADAVLLKQYTTVWTHTGKKMGWVSMYLDESLHVFIWLLTNMFTKIFCFKSWGYMTHLRHQLFYLWSSSFTYGFQCCLKSFYSCLSHPIWWPLLHIVNALSSFSEQNHHRQSIKMEFRDCFVPITPSHYDKHLFSFPCMACDLMHAWQHSFVKKSFDWNWKLFFFR